MNADVKILTHSMFRKMMVEFTAAHLASGFFIFLFFNFVFYKNIFLFSKFTEIYSGRPVVGRPAPGRPAAGQQGLFCKKFRGKFAPGPLEDRSPGSGAAGSGRPAAERPPPPLIYKGLTAFTY